MPGQEFLFNVRCISPANRELKSILHCQLRIGKVLYLCQIDHIASVSETELALWQTLEQNAEFSAVVTCPVAK